RSRAEYNDSRAAHRAADGHLEAQDRAGQRAYCGCLLSLRCRSYTSRQLLLYDVSVPRHLRRTVMASAHPGEQASGLAELPSSLLLSALHLCQRWRRHAGGSLRQTGHQRYDGLGRTDGDSRVERYPSLPDANRRGWLSGRLYPQQAWPKAEQLVTLPHVTSLLRNFLV